MDKRKLLIIGLGIPLTLSVLLYNLYIGYHFFIGKDVEAKWFWLFMLGPLVWMGLMYFFLIRIKSKQIKAY